MFGELYREGCFVAASANLPPLPMRIARYCTEWQRGRSSQKACTKPAQCNESSPRAKVNDEPGDVFGADLDSRIARSHPTGATRRPDLHAESSADGPSRLRLRSPDSYKKPDHSVPNLDSAKYSLATRSARAVPCLMWIHLAPGQNIGESVSANETAGTRILVHNPADSDPHVVRDAHAGGIPEP